MKKVFEKIIEHLEMLVFGQIHHLMKMDILMTIQKKL